MAEGSPRHTRGLLIVLVLGAIFFALIAALVVMTGKRRSGPPPVAESLTVLPLRIRLRTQPDARAAVVATATEGEKLVLLEDRGSWVRVQNGDGLAGWAERNALERTGEREQRLARYAAIRKLPPLAGTVRERTPLYAGPGIFYPVVGELRSGSKVTVYTRDHDFYAVDQESQVAYADIDAVDLSGSGTKQVDVGTSNEPMPTSTAGEPPQTASTAPETPVPAPVPPPAIPAAEPEHGGVYTAVPPGGTQPEEIERTLPRYPMAARAAGAAGAVVLRGVVRRDGTIDDVEILKDLPFGLGEAARDAVSHWRFRPATYHGEPIDVYYTVTVNFRLR